MNIRRIIKESIDDFDWIKDISGLTYEYLVNKALEFDPVLKDNDYYAYVIGTLRDLGFIINFSPDYPSDDEDGEGIIGLFIHKEGNVVWSGDDIMEDTYQEHIDDYNGHSVEVLNGRDLFPSNLNESTEGVDPFKWIRDIQIATPDLFKGRVDDFIRRFASRWDGYDITFEPISDEYSSGVREIGRVYMDEGEYSWYWDLLHDKNDESYIVEIFEKPPYENSYEAIERERFESLDESILYVFDTMAEE